MQLNTLNTPPLPASRPNPLRLAAILLACVALITLASVIQSALSGADLTGAANAASASPNDTAGTRCTFGAAEVEIVGLDEIGRLRLIVDGYAITVAVPR